MKNRIVSYRELALWVAVVVAALVVAITLAVVMSNTPAHAAAPRPAHTQRAADKYVVEKRDYWSSIRKYTAPNNVGTGTHTESYTVSIATNYLYWPDGGSVNKMAVEGGSVCYHRNTGNGMLFQGVNSNPYYRDDDNVVNPGAIEVEDDGTGYNCDVFNIPNSERRWFKFNQNPMMFATGKVRIQFTPDDNFDYRWAGQLIKPFEPGDDVEVGPWFFCECDYPGQ